MKQDTACIHGVKLEIVSKPAFEAVGYKRPVGLGDGSIARFLAVLTGSGKLQKLEETLCTPQQIWVCLSDCQSCGRGCAGTPICCRVCVEKTGAHDFSGFAKGELYTFPVPASHWVVYEAKDKAGFEYLHTAGIYELVTEIGWKWNESIRLHFDNEHECLQNGGWIPGKTYHFLLPVVPA